MSLSGASGDRRTEAAALVNTGLLRSAFGERTEALTDFSRALTLFGMLADVDGEASVLWSIAGIELEANQLDQARQHIESAIEIVESLRTKVASGDLRAAYLAGKTRTTSWRSRS